MRKNDNKDINISGTKMQNAEKSVKFRIEQEKTVR